MTENSRPWSGTSVGDAGAYADDDWHEAWRNMLRAQSRQAEYAGRGPIIDSGDPPFVGLEVVADSPASAAVVVKPGAAIVDGVFYISDAEEDQSISANGSGNDRIDTVVLRKSWAAQTVRLAVAEGTPAATPVPPSLTQTDGATWEIPIADVYVQNGFATIAQTDITPRQEWANIADGIYIKDVLNNSGVTLETGDAVIWDTSADRAVDRTTTIADPDAAGFWVGRTDDGDYGRVLVQGIGWVHVDGAYARGSGLYTSDTAGQALALSSAAPGNLGMLLEASSGESLVLAYVDVKLRTRGFLRYTYEVASGNTGPTYTSGADRTVPLNTEVYDDLGIGSVASNQVTLPAGTYKVRGIISAQGGVNSDTRLKIYDATGAAELLAGINRTFDANDFAITMIEGVFSITVSSDIELRIITSVTTLAAAAVGDGNNEIYAVLELERI